ncbi:MAG: hypothetical protein HOP10_03945 [Chitinophagaceae bacterium]|nr:hypothetical protein [Chitinophagaceae bacterium]
MKKLTTILFLTLSFAAFSQRTKENNPPTKTETGQTNTGNPNSSGQINLISPADAKGFEATEINKPILFRWAPVVPRPQGPVIYRLRVWQLMQGQNGTQAMSANQPVVTKDVSNVTQASVTVLTGPCKPPYLCDFIWAVEAISSSDATKSYGRSGAFSFMINEAKSVNAQGDPIHGVDIKLGFETKCDPIHGVDIKLGAIAKNANGDPVHGVDIKLGSAIKVTNANGDPVHGVDVKLGAVTKSVSANGDPVHGVDVKLGVKSASAQGDPIHGVDIKLGFEGKKEDVDQIQNVEIIVTVMATNANGDPAHGVDVKLGVKSVSANGDPVHGVDIKLGSKNLANGDPVHGVDIKLGATQRRDKELDKNQPQSKALDKELDKNQPQSKALDKELDKNQPQSKALDKELDKNQPQSKALDKELDKNQPQSKALDKELDKNQPTAKSMNAKQDLHPVSLPIEKIIYDAAGNIVEIVLKQSTAMPSPKVVVAGSKSISGSAYQPGIPSWGDDPSKNCKTVYCHNPLHSAGCGWLECK